MEVLTGEQKCHWIIGKATKSSSNLLLPYHLTDSVFTLSSKLSLPKVTTTCLQLLCEVLNTSRQVTYTLTYYLEYILRIIPMVDVWKPVSEQNLKQWNYYSRWHCNNGRVMWFTTCLDSDLWQDKWKMAASGFWNNLGSSSTVRDLSKCKGLIRTQIHLSSLFVYVEYSLMVNAKYSVVHQSTTKNARLTGNL